MGRQHEKGRARDLAICDDESPQMTHTVQEEKRAPSRSVVRLAMRLIASVERRSWGAVVYQYVILSLSFSLIVVGSASALDFPTNAPIVRDVVRGARRVLPGPNDLPSRVPRIPPIIRTPPSPQQVPIPEIAEEKLSEDDELRRRMDPETRKEADNALKSDKQEEFVRRCSGEIVAAYRACQQIDFGCENLTAVVDAYDANCPLHYVATHAAWKQGLDRVLGALYDSTRRQFVCTGALLDESRVITARHCMFGPDMQPIPVQNLAFRRVGYPEHSYPIASVAHSRRAAAADGVTLRRAHQSADFAVLTLGQVVVPAPPSIAFTSVTTPSRIVVPGFNWVVAYKSSSPLTDDNLGRWPDFVRYDDSETCRTIPSGNSRCLAHLCQTDSGMSGAPMLRTDDTSGEISFLGVHSGAAEPESDCPEDTGTGNVGVAAEAIREEIASANEEVP